MGVDFLTLLILFMYWLLEGLCSTDSPQRSTIHMLKSCDRELSCWGDYSLKGFQGRMIPEPADQLRGIYRESRGPGDR